MSCAQGCALIFGGLIVVGLLTSCNNPLGQNSSTDSEFLVGSQFTKNWLLDSAAGFTLSDSVSVQFGSDVCQLVSKTTDQSANCTIGFGDNVTSGCGGTFSGVTWDSANHYLRLEQTGTPTNKSALDASWAPAWASLRGYWRLDETAGTSFADSSGTGLVGTLNGGTTVGATGKLGKAVTFNGTTGYISTASAPTTVTNNWTLMAWAKPAVLPNGTCAPGGDSFTGFIVYNGTDAGGYGFGIGNQNSCGSILYGLYGSVAWIHSGYTFDAAATWYHIAMVRNAGVVSFFVNGVQTPNTSASTPNAVANSFRIGQQAGSPGSRKSFFNGSVDEVAIWTTALSLAEIQNIYERQAPLYSGTFTSRVMDAASSISWTGVGWKTTLPFLKHLPDAVSGSARNESSSDYSSLKGDSSMVGDNNLMNSIVGLWHLNEASGTSGAGSVLDRSGQGNNATPSSMSFGFSGPFGNAASFNGTTSNIDAGNNNSLKINSSFTLAAWVAPEAISGDILGNYDAGGGYALSLVSRQLRLYTRNAGTSVYRSGGSLSLRTMHHVVGVYDSLNSTFSLYLNGEPISISASSGTIASAFTASTSNFFIGKNLTGNGFLQGKLQEVAVWSKALNAIEVRQLFRRGGNRVKAQMRSCPDATCSSDPTWAGALGTNQTYFSERNNNTVAASGGDLTSTHTVLPGLPTLLFADFASLTLSAARYFQYRLIMESNDGGTSCNYGTGASWCSPEVQSVTIEPTRYDNTSPTVTSSTGHSFAKLSAFAETLGTGGCASGVTYNLSLDKSTWYYVSDSQWVIADGTSAEANAATVINSHIAQFPSAVGSGTLYFRAFLNSTGASKCELKRIVIQGTR